MDVQLVLSVAFLFLFAACVAVRAAMLAKKGIRAIVFGATDKSDFLLVPFILAIAYAALAKAFGLPMWEPLAFPFWDSPAPGWVGVGLCSAAIVGMVAALVSFGESFRVGIDEENPDKLVTDGLFAYSRNPIYVCFDGFFLGLFLIHRNIVILAATVGFALLIHRQILREERFLKGHYGDEYEAYLKKVRRYL